MNWSALKLPCTVLFGVALGWGIRGWPQWGIGAAQSSEAAAQGGSSVAGGRGPAGEAGAGKYTGKPSRERLETLAASFRSKCAEADEMTAVMAMTLEAGMLSGEEFGPLIALLAEDPRTWKGTQLLVVRWAMVDPKAALAFVLEQPENLSFWRMANWPMMEPVLQELAKVDLPAAKSALEHLEEMMGRGAERAIVRGLQGKDPRAAIAYAREVKDEEAEADVLARMAENDPLGAAGELIPGRQAHLKVVERIADSLLAKDREAFETWAGSLTDPAQKAGARCAALRRDAALDPAKTAGELAAWLAKEAETPAQAGETSRTIVQAWLKDKGRPDTVAAWVSSLPGGPARDAAIAETGSVWLELDILAASAWLGTLPQSSGKDGVVLQLLRQITDDTPADAFEWARTVETQTWRGEALREAVQSWAGQDPDAAARAVETLPPRDRVYLRDTLEAVKEERGKTTERK